MISVITTGILSVLLGASFRVFWSRFFMDKTLYYVPIYMVGFILIVTALASPKSVGFMIGVFCFDLIFFIIKDSEDDKSKYKKLLDLIMGKKDEKQEESV